MKDRLRRLDGVIEAYDVWPNPAVLGLSQRTYGFLVNRRSAAGFLAGAKQQSGYVGFAEFLPNWLNVSFACRTEADHQRIRAILLKAAGVAEPAAVFATGAWPVTRQPSALDWRILRAFRGDARRPYRQVASALGITARTVQRRLESLSRAHAFDTFVRLAPRAFDELLFFVIVFRIEPPAVDAAMNAIHGNLWGKAWSKCDTTNPESGHHIDLVCAPGSPSDLKAILREAEALPGILDVEAYLASAFEAGSPWLDRQLAAKATGTRNDQ